MPALCLSFLIVVLDQLTKWLVRVEFPLGHSIPVIPGLFSLTYVRNTGAAWGIMGGLNGWLAVLSIVMLVVIVVFRRSFLSDVPVHRMALGCMVGGIVGNLLDRVRLDYVVDFLDFHAAGHHFPAFNVADSAICVGVGLYVLSSFWLSAHPLNSAGSEPAKPAGA